MGVDVLAIEEGKQVGDFLILKHGLLKSQQEKNMEWRFYRHPRKCDFLIAKPYQNREA